jgi:hypothetical protein
MDGRNQSRDASTMLDYAARYVVDLFWLSQLITKNAATMLELIAFYQWIYTGCSPNPPPCLIIKHFIGWCCAGF